MGSKSTWHWYLSAYIVYRQVDRHAELVNLVHHELSFILPQSEHVHHWLSIVLLQNEHCQVAGRGGIAGGAALLDEVALLDGVGFFSRFLGGLSVRSITSLQPHG